jgi:hypothetical protein
VLKIDRVRPGGPNAVDARTDNAENKSRPVVSRAAELFNQSRGSVRKRSARAQLFGFRLLGTLEKVMCLHEKEPRA